MKTYFDTSIFIYALENQREAAQKMLLDAVRSGPVGISAVTIMEYCTGCYKHNRYDAAQNFRRFLSDYRFAIAAIDAETAEEAARIRAKYPGFKAMDSLQIASAKVAGADVFCTNDKQLLQFQEEKPRIQCLEQAS